MRPLDRLGEEERRRWRLITGPASEAPQGGDATAGGAGAGGGGALGGGAGAGGAGPALQSEEDVRRDRCMELVYGRGDGYGYATARGGGQGGPAPYIPAWLEDLRRGFPRPVVEQVQREALKHRGWERLILEPENLAALEHDANLVAALIALKDLVPEETKAVARAVVAEVVQQIERELRARVVSALGGRASSTRLRRTGPATRIDWPRTIRRSLKHYQPELETVVPDPVLFRDSEKRQFDDRHVLLLVDQSASMAASLVYAAVMGSVLASLRNLSTRMLLFDVRVVDVTAQLSDPVDVLFGAQLGGGTAIHVALAAAQALIVEPRRTLVVLISDLEEGADPRLMLTKMAQLKAQGATVLCLLNLDVNANPAFNRQNAREVARLGIPAFACTPDKLVDVLRCTLDGRSLATVGVEVPRADPEAM